MTSIGPPAPPPAELFSELPADVEPCAPAWPAWSAPVALVAAFAIALVGQILIALVATIGGYGIDEAPPGALIGGTAFQDLALIGAAVVFAGMTARPRPADFGLRPARIGTATGWLVLTWGAFLGFTAVWARALGVDESTTLPEGFGVQESDAALIATAALVTVLAPLAEEVFFRGFFFSALRGARAPWLAAVATGVVFGGIHAGGTPKEFLVPLMVFGAGLCLLYWRTDSLYPAIVLHCLNNCLAFGFAVGWSWEVPLLMLGANAAIAAMLWPLARPRFAGAA